HETGHGTVATPLCLGLTEPLSGLKLATVVLTLESHPPTSEGRWEPSTAAAPGVPGPRLDLPVTPVSDGQCEVVGNLPFKPGTGRLSASSRPRHIPPRSLPEPEAPEQETRNRCQCLPAVDGGRYEQPYRRLGPS